MTPEEEEKCYAVFEFNVGGKKLLTRVYKSSYYNDLGVDEQLSWIRSCFNLDIDRLEEEIKKAK